MSVEVEMKFPVSDFHELKAKLAALGLNTLETISQVDTYFNHPQRDFAVTDEAVRIRRVGQLNYITYKGPKLDSTTKSRREIEIGLEPGDEAAGHLGEMLLALGFRRVADVRKQRRHGQLLWQGDQVEVALDEVERVGAFVELEIVAAPADLDAARQRLMSLAQELRLVESERRSYLQLLLGAHNAPSLHDPKST